MDRRSGFGVGVGFGVGFGAGFVVAACLVSFVCREYLNLSGFGVRELDRCELFKVSSFVTFWHKATLLSYSQILLSSTFAVGWFVIAALFLKPYMLIASLCAVFAANGGAIFFGFDRKTSYILNHAITWFSFKFIIAWKISPAAGKTSYIPDVIYTRYPLYGSYFYLKR